MTPLLKGLDMPTKIGLLLVHGSNFGQMPFPSLSVLKAIFQVNLG